MLDKWSLIHICLWVAAGAGMVLFGIPSPWRWIIVLGGAALWEVVETILEKTTDIASNEGWENRWISDIAVSVLGAMAGMQLVS